ncbi:MAG TPA: Hsp70 family protein [Kineosporiaceae bacterium]|nr:Hsp70 family protein [Kineosporiaceae bacterium]
MYGAGIDLGTTRTAAAVWSAGRVRVLPLEPAEPPDGPVGTASAPLAVPDPGDGGCPSAVLIEADGGVQVGSRAERLAADRPQGLARAFKRRFGDEIPYLLSGHELTAEELTGHLLGWVLAALTRSRRGVPPDRTVLTVPATWQDYRLRCLDRVTRAAGLAGVTVLPEPAAAAVFYAGRDQVLPGTTVGVYDFGGGTFDATLLRKTSGGFEILGEPLGLDAVGGVDLDDALLRLVAAELGGGWSGLDRDEPDTRRALARLRDDVVRAKETLSVRTELSLPVRLPGLARTLTLRRAAFEDAVRPLVEQTVELMADAIDQAGLGTTGVDRILLVGGSSGMPLVERLLAERLGIPTVRDAHPKHAVCLGAAIAAGSLLAPGPAVPAPGHGHATAAPVPADVLDTAEILDAGQPGASGGLPGLEVDLADHGLADAARVPVRPAAELRRRLRPAEQNEPLHASLAGDDAYGQAARRAALLVIGLVTALVLVAALLRGGG